MKRSNSSQELGGGKSNKSRRTSNSRYGGRYSFPKLVASGRKKIKPRQSSPRRLSEYLEEFEDQDEFYVYKSGTAADGSEVATTSSHDLRTPSPEPNGVIDELRSELQSFTKRTMTTDSMNVGRAAREDGGSRRLKFGMKFGEFLWLNLSAFFASRQMNPACIQSSLSTQNMILQKKRQEQERILKDIADFSLPQYELDDGESWIQRVYSRKFVAAINDSRRKVRELLERYEELLALFSTYRAMSEALDIQPEVRARVLALYSWLNTLEDLIAKIQQMGHYFEHLDDRDRRKRSAVEGRRSEGSSGGSFSRFLWPRFPVSEDEEMMEEDGQEKNENMNELECKFANLYVSVVSKSLRLRGIMEILDRLNRIGGRTTDKACLYFLHRRRYADVAGDSKINALAQRLHRQHEPAEGRGQQQHFEDACKHTFANPLVHQMRLPSFFPLFVFHLRVTVDLVHQWLKMRAEKVASQQLDFQTLQTFIEDAHDMLNAGVKIKNDYLLMVEATSQPNEQQALSVEEYDESLELVFRNYLSYLRSWAQLVAAHNNSHEMTEKLLNTLNKEWLLAKRWASCVNQGEQTAAKRFCALAVDFITTTKTFKEEHLDLVDQAVLESQNSTEDEFELVEECASSSILIVCRALKEMNRNLRDRALKSLHFLRTLCNDLEFTAKYTAGNDASDLLAELLHKNHSILRPTNVEEANFLILANHRSCEITNRLLSATFAVGESAEIKRLHDHQNTHYVVLIPLDAVPQEALQSAAQVGISLDVSARFALNHSIATNGVYLLANSRSALDESRIVFESAVDSLLHDGRLVLLEDATSINEQLGDALTEVKNEVFESAGEMWTHAEELNGYVLNGRAADDLAQSERAALNSTLLQAFNTSFEYYKEFGRIVSHSQRRQFYSQVVGCVGGWANFVCRSIRVIRRSTPQWILAPINYLLSLPRSAFEEFLDEAEVESFATNVRKCLQHLDQVAAQAATSSDSCSQTVANVPLFNQLGALNLDRFLLEKKSSVKERIAGQIAQMDSKRDEALRSAKAIGNVIQRHDRYDFISRLASKPAPFQWHRLENKMLGRGAFGTVYLVANRTSNCLMAMKKIEVQRENNAALKALADEVEILRNLNHPNLIKYYGVDLSGDELLIFTEYCSEGTLQRVCREGMELDCVRRYAHYLLEAVAYLHAHGIVHRDIKPANIFLSSAKSALKLGDFGCSQRIQSNVTRWGEMMTFVGTVRYAAPELHTGGTKIASQGVYSGYGRAVDIWACGCVVLEMLTGKPPFHHLEHEFQIIFAIGSGTGPRIPPEISRNPMTATFLADCFKVAPDERPDARTLLSYPFANIVITEDSQDVR